MLVKPPRCWFYTKPGAGNVQSCVKAICLIPLILSACAAREAPQPPSAPISVEVVTVAFRELRQWDDFTGRLEAVESVDIRPRIGGFIDAINFTDGARVHRGDVLYQIDPRPYQAEVNRAAAEVKRAKAASALAHADGDRSRRLIEQDAIARSEFERFDAADKVAEAGLAAANAAIDVARLNLAYTRVESPIDGRASKALITKGNLVTPGSVLTTIVSDSPIFATFNIDEQAYLRYASGQRDKNGPAYVGLATESGFPHKGTLGFLDNSADPGSGTVSARATLENADGVLTPGLYSRVRLVSSLAERIAVLPEQALATDLGKRYVLVVDQTRHVEYRAVTLGPAVGELRVVRSGLAPGDQVIVAGLQKVKPGDLVSPTQSERTISSAELAALDPES